MLYCPRNITFLKPWVDHSLSHCFIDTISSAFIMCFVIIFGGVQIRMYKRYSSDLDPRIFPHSFMYKLQIACHFFLSISALIRLILQISVLYDLYVYGYMILSACFYFSSFPFALYLLFLERHKALPSIPTRGHGLVLLIFWTSVFITENLTILNIQNEKWWFNLQSSSDKIEFGFFVFRYVCSCFLFVLGLKAPGIPTAEDYSAYRQLHLQIESGVLLESGNRQTSRNRSTFSEFGKKCKRLIPFLWPKKSIVLQLRVVMCFFILILGRVINVFVPQYNKHIVDSLSLPVSQITFRWDYILMYVLFWFLQGQGNNSFLSNIRSFLWIRVQQYTVKEVELEMYEHLHSLSLSWHLSRKIGEVLRVMDRGTSSISNLLSYIVFNIIPTFADIFIAVIYFALAFNIWFGVIVLVTMLLYLGLTIYLTEWRTKFRRNVNRLDNEVEAKCVDSLLNFETVKYYNAEKYELENYKNAIDNYQVAEWASTASLNLLNTVQNIVITSSVLCGAMLCAHYVVEGKLTAGDWVLFSTYILQLYIPLNFFGTYYRMIQTAFVDMENMFTLLNTEPEIIDIPNAFHLKVGDGCIEFKNVHFSYVPERQILKNISFVVPPGHTVALVGPTGSGKSTITRLLFRLYDVQSGEILIDGQNIAKVTQKSLRQSIGVVPQDTVLFNNTIRYNIGYGRPTACDEEIEEAAKAADMHNQILSFPEGYDTVVGERGLKLSGGEKQRVAIARTILKAPSFIILDEATSSLDTQTERNIQNSLAAICSNRTTLIIAHRLSTIIHADEILVLKEGEIIERGSIKYTLKH
ncbi:ATP-binding cassette sub-family B member 6, mitochondrial-like isoform X2 [Stegodyphus dumicola]|uniref:ATP-binding cassette sub-family B member 6, mitochondrial-like isoform X2 n=1 Tax=Stegodyphus dumicola TaxID=202533 RepID=UPI0015AAD4B3|nr:ATP-binding cassette sub-family B member 6, mitochondrial-like isoform X2 [Stegodyphus dumicola]